MFSINAFTHHLVSNECGVLIACVLTASFEKQEDLLIPGSYSFYDFIVTKARGKSGPLFNFDVHDDVRLMNDATVEKDESHAGKVCHLCSCGTPWEQLPHSRDEACPDVEPAGHPEVVV